MSPSSAMVMTVAMLAGCGAPHGGADASVADAAAGDLSVSCPGTPPTTQLKEGYCKSGEAARCNYDSNPFDGF